MSGVDEFIGCWREVEKSGFEEMAEAVGMDVLSETCSVKKGASDFCKNLSTQVSLRSSRRLT